MVPMPCIQCNLMVSQYGDVSWPEYRRALERAGLTHEEDSFFTVFRLLLNGISAL